MADENGFVESELVDNREHVFAQPRNVIAGLGSGGDAVSASRNGDDTPRANQLRREVVKDVTGVSESGEQHNLTTLAAEIEHLELDIVSDRDHLDTMRRPVYGLRRLQEHHGKRENHGHCDD